MSKKSVFTTITPLPASISRETAQEALRDHKLMIDLNPLVIERKLVPKAPHFASAEEYNCKWYLITDRISYMPGRMVTGKVDYYACFHDLPDGLQTHCFAPMGLDIRSRWTIGGSLAGEPKAPTELGLGIPKEGLYLREDVQMKCNIMLQSFVKKTFKKSHERLVDRLGEKTHSTEVVKHNERLRESGGASYAPSGTHTPSTGSYPGSPPLGHASPRFSSQFPQQQQGGRPESPAHNSFYGSPMMAAQLAAQGIDPNQAFVSPLYNQVDPAYLSAMQQQQQPPPQPGQPGWQEYQAWLAKQQQQYGQYQQHPQAPQLQHQQQQYQQAPGGAVEIGSGELQHPAVRQDGKGQRNATSFAPAELQG